MPKIICLLGAARSGTKLLRDTLASTDGVASVPYDINYLWRLGNERCEHDELAPDSIDSETAAKIRSLIKRYAGEDPVLVEKTVGNSLRPDFVRRVFPEATFVALLRNGYDVTESSMRQWVARPDLSYLVSKALRFPWSAAPGYAFRYASEAARGVFGAQSPSWGPRYRGMKDDVAGNSLAYVCATQWANCVLATLESLCRSDQLSTVVSYEGFVAAPHVTLASIADACQIPWTGFDITELRSGEVGKGRRALDKEVLEVIAPIIEPIHERVATVAGIELG